MRKPTEDWTFLIEHQPEAKPAGQSVPPRSRPRDRMRHAFDDAVDGIPGPRLSSAGRTNANIKWLLANGWTEATVRASFDRYALHVRRLAVLPRRPLWDDYFATRERWLS